jgi:transposase
VEVRERGVRLVLERCTEYETEWAAICSISAKLGCSAETLRGWVRQALVDRGARPGASTADVERINELERKNRELRRANEILKAASTSSRWSSTRSREDERGDRRAPRGVRGRADLQDARGRPIHLLPGQASPRDP